MIYVPFGCGVELWVGDVLEGLRAMGAGSAQCVVTSPPYWALRDYGCDGQLGLERSVEEYVARMGEVFDEVRRVLADDGVLWVNIGDCYAGDGGSGRQGESGQRADRRHTQENLKQRWNSRSSGLGGGLSHQENALRSLCAVGCKPKDLVGVPWMLAFELRRRGWWLRQEVIWNKTNVTPESCRDRPTRAHEQVFLLSKSERYFWNRAEASEEVSGTSHRRGPLVANHAQGAGAHRAVTHNKGGEKDRRRAVEVKHRGSMARWEDGTRDLVAVRNVRSVWPIATEKFPGRHYATFPRELARRCLVAGSRPGDVVLDPFAGTGTVLVEAAVAGRVGVGIDLDGRNVEHVRWRMERAGMSGEG